jgi:4-hydroxy-tetrahydrodipicolinate synthase
MFSGSLVALVTPMSGDGALDMGAWDRLIDLHLHGGTTAIVVGGSTGESVTLTDAEQETLLERARRRIAGRMAVIAGVGGSNTAAVAARVRALSAAAPDALLAVTPAYSRPTQEGLYRHMHALAEASTVPVLLYNVPGRTAVDLQPPTVARLAVHPRIVGIKEALGDLARVRELVAAVPGNFAVLSGDDATACEAVLAGARGVISVTANLLPQAVAAVMAAAMRGEREQAMRLDAPLQALHRALGLEANPIPVKWALAEMHLISQGIRLPLTWLSAAMEPQLRAALAEAGMDAASLQALSA